MHYNSLNKQKSYNAFFKNPFLVFHNQLPTARPVILDQYQQVCCIIENPLELQLNQELNGKDTIEFTIPYDDINARYLVNEEIVRLLESDYIIRTVTKTRDRDGKKTISVYGEAVWYNLQYASPLNITSWSEATPKQVFNDILQDTEWSLGEVTSTTLRDFSIDSELTNRLKALRDATDLWGGTLFFDIKERVVHLIEGDLGDPGVSIVYQKNMKTIEAIYDTQDLITRLYPYGKGSLTIEDANNGQLYVENYQYTNAVRVRTFKDTRFTNPYYLKEKAEEILEQLSLPRASYSITAADLSDLAGLEHEAFKLGYLVRVYDEELDVNLKTQIVKWSYNVLEPWNTELELSTSTPGLEDLLKSVTEATNQVQSEDSLSETDILNLSPYNYLLNSRAEDGDAYWVNNGWEIDSTEGYSGTSSFLSQGEYDVEKTLSQTVYPSNREMYTLSFRSMTEGLTVGKDGKVGIEVTVTYEDGTTETEFLSLA